MTYAVPADIAVLLGYTFTAEQTAQAQGFLDDAEWQIKDRIPDLAAKITAGDITADAVKRVEIRAVRRVMLNPEGKDNEKVDDYSYGFTDGVAESEVSITDQEWSWLIPQAAPGDAFSIRLGGVPRVVG